MSWLIAKAGKAIESLTRQFDREVSRSYGLVFLMCTRLVDNQRTKLT